MPLPWITKTPGAPYFQTEHGTPWHPIGQNDSIAWKDLQGLVDRRNLTEVANHLAWLKQHGVTLLRLMLEDAETGRFFWEQPAGTLNPALTQLWDDLFTLVENAGLRILLTPMDTYFHWVRWDIHPWNSANGGPCDHRISLMVHPGIRTLIKARLDVATTRWGHSGALFAWDIWNEMHPVQGEDRPGCLEHYIDDVAPWLRALETTRHGRAHLQTASVFGPELHWKPWLNDAIFRHPQLDFANNHFYEEGTIDHPADTVAPARAAARLVQEALSEIKDARPFFETEHGPIHAFKDLNIILPEPFDDEYFRHIQWAHLAAGAAGGGMRWPNRHPHQLTHGMRRAQRAMAAFLPFIDWQAFRRHPLPLEAPGLAITACADGTQAILFLLRTTLLPDGRVDPTPHPGPTLTLPLSGTATFFDPVDGTASGHIAYQTHLPCPDFGPCLAIAITPSR